MAALGQPVPPAEQLPAYASPFQQPMQGMYQDPYMTAQGYSGAAYTHAPLYQDLSSGMYAGNNSAAGALQWEMPQVRRVSFHIQALWAYSFPSMMHVSSCCGSYNTDCVRH